MVEPSGEQQKRSLLPVCAFREQMIARATSSLSASVMYRAT
jgi:hypothetical protein